MSVRAPSLLALFVLACGPSSVTPAQAYEAAQLKCVHDARTLAESRACRRAVDARFGVDGGS